jgi:hypothetical protein
MDIPNGPLNSTDKLIHESQEVDAQAANSQPVVREASKQMESHRGSQSVRRKIRSGREFKARRFCRPQRKVWDNVKRNFRAFCELLMRSIHSQIIIATIERPSRTSPGASSLVDALRLTKSPGLPPHNAILVRC